MRAVENAAITDIYACGIDRVDLLPGGNVRVVFYTEEQGERVIVCKIVRPANSVMAGDLVQMIAAARFAAISEHALAH